MADIIIKDTTDILKRVAEENRRLGETVSLWLKKGPNGECIARVIPCKMSTQLDEYTTNKNVRKKSWTRKLHFDSGNFDFEGIDIVEEVFVPVRKHVRQAVLFFKTSKEKDGVTIDTYKMMTANAYLEDGKGERNSRVKDLPNDLKEEFLQQATEELIDFLLEHANEDLLKVVESTEAYYRKMFN
jgi:hypothetical protein